MNDRRSVPMDDQAVAERARWVADYERRERQLDAERKAKEPKR